MPDFSYAGGGNGGKKIAIILIVLLIVCCFIFRNKITDTYYTITQKISEVFEGNKVNKSSYLVDDAAEDENVEDLLEKDDVDSSEETEVVYIVTESSINIRDGAGVDFKQIGAAKKGDEFIGTGNVEEASNGRPWFEVYLNDDRTEIGWISSKVASPKEE